MNLAAGNNGFQTASKKNGGQTTYTPPTLTRSQIRSNVTKYKRNSKRNITIKNVHNQLRTNIQPIESIEPILHPEYISQVPSPIRVKNVQSTYKNKNKNPLTREGRSKGFPKKPPSVRRKQ